MDPITTAIIAAACAGVTSGAAKEATIDAYNAIKNVIKSKFGHESKVLNAITALEENPESKGQQLVLSEQMKIVKADRDPELQTIATQLINALKETEAGRGALARYYVVAKDSQIGVIGDKAKIKNGIHFHEPKK